MMTKRLLLMATLALAGLGFVHSASAAMPGSVTKGGDTPSLAPMLEGTTSAVVNVLIKPKRQALRQNPLFQNPFFRRFFGQPKQQQQRRAPQKPRPVGSGVIVDAADGIVLTNNHVVEPAKKVWVRLKDERRIEAEVLGTDPQSDIAVLQVEADNLSELPLADSEQLRVGDFVVAIGNPFGLNQTVTSGIVSGLGRHGLGNRYENFIQTDASINPGNSGGALVNLKGELVGINSTILSKSGGNIGIGFAIPINMAKTVMHQIREYGEVRRGRLGVVGQNLTSKLADAMSLDVTQGVLIAKVLEDSPAADADIQERDVITAVNGTQIEDFSNLANAVGLRSPGEEITITLLRDGEQQQVSATLGQSEGGKGMPSGGSGGLFKGLDGAKFGSIPEDHPLAGQIQGVAVTRIAPGSPAARSGLKPGDVVTSVNREAVKSIADFRKLASADADKLLLHVRRDNGALFLLIR